MKTKKTSSQKLRVGIYDKWLNSMGGGEKVATVMAEVLSKAGHKVDIISNFDCDMGQLESKMGVDLSRVNTVVWYERSYSILSPKTKKYDLFINVSFLDHLPSLAKKSIYYILFPTPMKNSLLGFLKYETVLPILRNMLIVPEVIKGLEPIDDVYTRGGRWLSAKNTIVFSNTPKKFSMIARIYVEQISRSSLALVSFASPNASVKVVDRYIDHDFNIMACKLEVISENSNTAIDILVDGKDNANALGLVSMTVRNPRFFMWNLIKRYMPRYEMALYGSSSYKTAAGLDTYKSLLADSKFSQKWTKKYWGREAGVLYPPIDTHLFKAAKKEKIILNVGRFFVGGHAKRQDILIEAFKRMVDQHMVDTDWELHLVGGISAGKQHTDYVSTVEASSVGYKIKFHYHASFYELKKYYGKASIYWHATGYGVNANREPIRTEHFGITPVEAMAAGAVPIVYKEGGLSETVGDNEEQTWKTISELADKTASLINSPKKLARLSRLSVQKAKYFSRENFASQLIDEIEK